MCANGSRQERGIDFDHSWYLTISSGSCCMTLLYDAVFRLTLAMIDVVNCSQNTLQEDHERFVVTVPPYYLGWFRKRSPEIKIVNSSSEKYFLQLIKELQGDTSIGRKWCLLVKRLLKPSGFVVCPVEPALY